MWLPDALSPADAENMIHQIGDITVEVGYVETKNVQGNFAPVGNEIGWDRVTLQNSFPNLGIITSLQTMNNETNPVPTTISSPWITPTVKVVNDNQFDVTLDMSETATGVVSTTERVAYIAFSCGQTTTFTDNNGTTIKAETKKMTNIVGWDNGGTNVSYSNTYSSTPLSIASINSRKSTEGGWIRYDTTLTSASQINLKIDHDSTQNIERKHTAEDAAMLTISGLFNLKII